MVVGLRVVVVVGLAVVVVVGNKTEPSGHLSLRKIATIASSSLSVAGIP